MLSEYKLFTYLFNLWRKHDVARAILWSLTELADFGFFLLDAVFGFPLPLVLTHTWLIKIRHCSVQSKSSRNLIILCLFQTISSLSSILKLNCSKSKMTCKKMRRTRRKISDWHDKCEIVILWDSHDRFHICHS